MGVILVPWRQYPETWDDRRMYAPFCTFNRLPSYSFAAASLAHP